MRRSTSFRRDRNIAASGLALTLVLTGCGQGVSDTDDDQAVATVEPTQVTNCGELVSVEAVPERIVGLSPGATEVLLRLGLADRLVGQAQTTTAQLPTELQAQVEDVPSLSEDVPPAREDLLSVEPDFVLTPTTYEFTAEQGFASRAQLADADVAAYVATGGCFDRRMEGTVEDLFVDLDDLGALLGVQEQAADLVAEYRDVLADVAERTGDLEQPTVAQVFVDGTSLTAIGAGVEYDIIDRAGGDNVFSPDDPAFADFFAAQINPEVLAERDPEVLVFAVSGPDEEQQTREYLTSTFPALSAVANDRLIAIDTSATYPGALGNVQAVREIAEGLYPDAF